ncbi:class I SAM-dependent methyltransferase [Microbacterium sp. ASV49]|uniref:Methyltransferase domain-containing protein n=1 Tax=Microbacterium candidum TaxID=3041922 RepID=A0ABT7N1U6_9MICO|nr:methyltransferase domain-containing protein [Microbacterium sp. ASV49]MDL9980640.1 methyltransferase domain-containing protein [Microbacterium sp. ASV49]
MKAGEWADTAEAYADSFGRLCAGAIAPMLDAVARRVPAGSLLDAGSGTGDLAEAARDRGYDVTGVDAAPSMVALASVRHPGLTFSIGELPSLAFADASFDVVTANFVVNHVADPRSAVRELARLSSGAVGVSIWPSGPSAMGELWNGVICDADAVPLTGQRLAPELDYERSPVGLAGILAEAGLSHVRAGSVSWSFDISPTDLWGAVEGGIATIGLTYAAQDVDRRDAMRAAYGRRTADLAPEGILHLPSTAIIAVGTAR